MLNFRKQNSKLSQMLVKGIVILYHAPQSSTHSLLYTPTLRERDPGTYWLGGWVDGSVGPGTDMKRHISPPPPR